MNEILCITSYPPRECGIATFSDDLINAIQDKFGESYSMRVCAIESKLEKHAYPPIVKYVLDTSVAAEFTSLAEKINKDSAIDLVCIQHEFGLFSEQKESFPIFLESLHKPIVIVFHTVLPHPLDKLRSDLQRIARSCSAFVVMTHASARILREHYQIPEDRIHVIPHGTHLVSQMDRRKLKERYGLNGRQVLSTFGLLSPGKSIETTLEALPAIIRKNPSVLFLIIGKTHPTILKTEGDTYRKMLENKVKELKLENHVRFINLYLKLRVLLEYLQLTDIYLFTSCDRNQAVSGTFVYALSCGCPIIATPIPHALELLTDNTGIIFDFKDASQLAESTNRLLNHKQQQVQMRINNLQKMAATTWPNAAIAYASLFSKEIDTATPLRYSLPPFNIDHIKRMSRGFAMVQFAKGNRPDINTGYTIDDNARALVAICQTYEITQDQSCGKLIKTYLDFIQFCAQPDGHFLNYVDKSCSFTPQNQATGLEDCNGRTVYALGYYISQSDKYSFGWPIEPILSIFKRAFPMISQLQSPRGIAFCLKGLAHYHQKYPSTEVDQLIRSLADKLVACYEANAEKEKWMWFEPYLTYDNSVLPESLVYAYQITQDERYRNIARESFDFLLGEVFEDHQIHIISNQGWHIKNQEKHIYGEQPIDVAGTVIALNTFYHLFKEERYQRLKEEAFYWFLGNNHLHQIIYNPTTGGCYDGLEEHNINLNQGAESSVCYLLARVTL